MDHDICHKTVKWLRAMRVVVLCMLLGGIGLSPKRALAQQEASASYHVTASASSRAARRTPAKLFRYARRVIEKYDDNQNGQLEQNEWSRMAGEPQRVDSNSDKIITLDEFVAYVSNYAQHRNIRLVVPKRNLPKNPSDHLAVEEDAPSENENTLAPNSQSIEARATFPSKARQKGRFYVPSSHLPGGLPSWFRSRDTNGDGQVSVAEFSHGLDPTELREFSRYDLNRDGVLVPEEFIRRNSMGSSDGSEKTPENKQTTLQQSPALRSLNNRPDKAPRSSSNTSDKRTKSTAIRADKESRSAEARRRQKQNHSKKRKKSTVKRDRSPR